MTIGVPIITCLHRVRQIHKVRVRRIHKAAQMPLLCETSITRAWAVATACHPWAGLTLCLHGRPCVWLPFAVACCYTLFCLLMMPAARLVCQRPSSNFPYFRTPLAIANFLLSRSNSVAYGNSKTTRPTLLSSAKCTRSLFQCRTGCGGRPSGWHDIVTCQRLVLFNLWYFLLPRVWRNKVIGLACRVGCKNFAIFMCLMYRLAPKLSLLFDCSNLQSKRVNKFAWFLLTETH